MRKQLICSLTASGILLCPFSSLASDKQEKFLQKLEDVKNRITTRLRSPSTPRRPASEFPTSLSSKPTVSSKNIVFLSPKTSSSLKPGPEKKEDEKKSFPTKPLPPLPPPHFQSVSQSLKGKTKSTENSCPETLTYYQLIEILNADFDTTRKSTQAIQIDEETQISVKARSRDSIKTYLQAIEKAGKTVEAKFGDFKQPDYRGGTVAVQGEDNVIGFLATYEVKKGGIPLKFGNDIELTLSITKKKKS